MPGRVVIAVLVASVGTAVFLVVRALLVGLLEPWEYVVGCFSGALLSTLAFVPKKPLDYASALVRAFPIVLFTYLAIGAAHVLHSLPHWDNTEPEEAGILLFWAVLTTGWWLPFGTALTIVGTTRVVAGSASAAIRRECDAMDPWKR